MDKSLNEMRLEQTNIEADLRSMKAKLESEGREPNDDEMKKATDLLDRADKLDEMIEVEARRVKLEARYADPKDPEKDKAMKPEPESRRKEKFERGNPNPFNTMGDQLACIMRAGIEGRVDPRLHEVRAATGLSEGVGGDGGFLLQPQFTTELLKVSFETGVLAKLCRTMPMSSNQLIIPGWDETNRATGSRYGGVQGYWLAEAAEKSASHPKFRRIELNANKAAVLVYTTDELLEDHPALEAHVREAASGEIGFMIDDGIVEGTGAGRPLGIKNAGCLVSVSKEGGQAATTFIYENACNMWARLLPQSQKNAVWLINQDVWPQLFTMNLAVGAGGAPVFLPAGGASASPYASMFGRPIMPIEQCETLGTSGDVYLCDFKNGYVLGQKGGLKSDVSIHVRFIYDESVFRFVIRVDGQPILAAPITPFKGTGNTLSHFVACNDR